MPAKKTAAKAKKTAPKARKVAPKKVAAKKPAARKAAPRKAPMKPEPVKITYATLSAADETMHASFDAEVAQVKAQLEAKVPMIVNGQERWAEQTFPDTSPIDTRMILGHFQKGTREDGQVALAAARAAFQDWGRMPWRERVKFMRKAAKLIEQRIHHISAVVALEVGKNRLEAWGDVQETADLISYYCDQMEENKGFVRQMASEDPKKDPRRNLSVLKPYGVWVVISPWNFPMALAGGPSGGALVAGNTVVFKPATDTPYSGYLLAKCFVDAGLPDGVFNYVTGPGSTIGDELVTNPEVNGITFTGSYDVGMHILRAFAQGRYPRPCVAELGGKNPAIVTRTANLELAAMGVMRSAFGLQGQKCSACSRIYVDRAVKNEFVDALLEKTRAIKIGDPTVRENWFGPVANRGGYESFANYVAQLDEAGRIIHGGHQIREGDYQYGYFCEPTLVDDLPLNHALWKEEMFLPISTIAAYDTLDEAMRLANDVDYGLTAGVFAGDPAEVQWFFDNIQAGTTYANRRGGATTGAWPGYQPFGGWKGSGSTGKSGGSLYYVQQYMHEQSQTWIHNPS